ITLILIVRYLKIMTLADRCLPSCLHPAAVAVEDAGGAEELGAGLSRISQIRRAMYGRNFAGIGSGKKSQGN
uniref:Uncharacterized protein n=1 Tax=Aegilops tauschii subsp. strangulata TaxID=200361 RepID=A0A452YL03_AEGTS